MTGLVCDAPAKRSPNFDSAKGLCRWCGESKGDRRSLAEFCSQECRYAFHNRQKTQGAAILAQVKRWQKAKRGKDRGRELTLLEKMARQLNALDTEIGVSYLPPVPAHFHATVVAQNIAGNKRR